MIPQWHNIQFKFWDFPTIFHEPKQYYDVRGESIHFETHRYFTRNKNKENWISMSFQTTWFQRLYNANSSPPCHGVPLFARWFGWYTNVACAMYLCVWYILYTITFTVTLSLTNCEIGLLKSLSGWSIRHCMQFNGGDGGGCPAMEGGCVNKIYCLWRWSEM